MRNALFIIGIILLLLDIAFLNASVLLTKKGETKDSVFNVVTVSKPSATDSATKTNVIDSCSPYSCVDLIKQATASLTQKESSVAKPAKSSATATREFYVPFGGSQTLSDQWEDAPGLQVYIDSTKYGKIKTVTFEATMRIPTANGRFYAQLYNATDDHPVWFSEVSMEGDKPQLLVSSPITLDSGNKLYKVQMKTTLKYQSIIDQARVHILTE